MDQNIAQVGLGLILRMENEKKELAIILRTPIGEDDEVHTYGGSAKLAPIWAVNTALNRLRERM